MVDASSSTALPGDTAGACFAAAIYCRLGERRERFEPGLRPGRPHVGSLFDCLAPLADDSMAESAHWPKKSRRGGGRNDNMPIADAGPGRLGAGDEEREIVSSRQIVSSTLHPVERISRLKINSVLQLRPFSVSEWMRMRPLHY